ncbi:MAG TPA: hypothetical protein VF171_01870 [Trueperaceae bacterium]
MRESSPLVLFTALLLLLLLSGLLRVGFFLFEQNYFAETLNSRPLAHTLLTEKAVPDTAVRLGLATHVQHFLAHAGPAGVLAGARNQLVAWFLPPPVWHLNLIRSTYRHRSNYI